MQNVQEILDNFHKDIKDHVLTVKHDDGVYRHLRFSKPNTNIYWFDLITWPGHLAVTGDMGTYVFARVEDMFNFFHEPYSLGYWAEKLQAGVAKEFSYDVFKNSLTELIDSYYEDYPDKGDKEAAKTAIFDEFDSEMSEGDIRATIANNPQIMQMDCDFHWESDFDDFTFSYIWNIYAIVHGIKEYKKSKDTIKVVEL